MIEVNDASVEVEVVESDVPVVVDFYATWCGPCKTMAPIFENLAKTFEGKAKFVKVNVEVSPNIAQEFDVRSIPTLAIVKHGVVIDKLVGVQTNAKMVDWILLNI